MANHNSILEGLTEQDISRFWLKVDKTPGQGPHGECWEWTANRPDGRYGKFTVRRPDGYPTRRNGGINVSAHRVAYRLHYNINPLNSLVCHSCDNPPCVNPDHLFLGTHQDNQTDCTLKGRKARGSRNGAHTKPERIRKGSSHGMSILTEADIPVILKRLAAGEQQTRIAQYYGVVPQVIWAIHKNRLWKHVARP